MMDNEIFLPRGTSLSIGIWVQDADGQPYYDSGDTVRFGVKYDPDDTTYAVQKTAAYDEDNGCYVVTLVPSDTASLPFGRYWYDIGLQTDGEDEDDYYMLVDATAFNVTKAITGVST